MCRIGKSSILAIALAFVFALSCLPLQAMAASEITASSPTTYAPSVGVTQPPSTLPTNVTASPTLVPQGGSVIISWTKVSEATKYRIRLYRMNSDGSFSNINIGTSLFKDYGDVSSITLSGLSWLGTYKVLVAAGNDVGWDTTGVFSNTYVVAVPALSNVKASPTSVNRGGSVTISWSKVAGATYYRIRLYSKNSNGTYSNIKIGSSYYRDYAGSVSSVTLVQLSTLGTYKVLVFFGNASGTHTPGTFTNTFNVVVPPPPAPPVTSVSAKPLVVKKGGSLTISWTKPSGATYYRVRLYRKNPNGSFSNIMIGTGYYKDYGDVSSATLSGLSWLGTYKIMVLAGGASGWYTPSTFSNVFYIGAFTGNATLDAYIVSIQNSLGYTGDVLRKSFNYVTTYPYIYSSGSPTGDYSAPYALDMIQKHGGNCYRFAALFCVLARAYGYDARVISGSVPRFGGGWAPHGWVEIVQNGQVYVCDPDLAKEYPGPNWFMFPYSQQPTTYRK